MYPTIQKGSFVFVDKRGQPNQGTFGFHPFRFEPTAKISRTDMIVFRTPHDPEVTYLMRVIGVPGDRVIYRNHRLTLNDESVPISFGGTAGAYQLATEIIDGHEVQIALLPNRPSPELDVVVPPDHYLVLGDSRDNARDSRFVGFIPRENIVGRVAKIFQSGEEPTRY